MARPVGRAFKITKRQSRSYSYAKPRSASGLKRNGGVTTIAAINGRGSYRSGRASMAGLTRKQRINRARRQLSSAERKAFAANMAAAREAKRNGRRPLKRRITQSSPSRRRKRLSANSAHVARSTSPMKRNKRRRKVSASPTKRRRKTGKRRRRAVAKTRSTTKRKRRKSRVKATATPKRRRRKSKRRAKARTKRTTKRRRRSRAKLRANPRRRRRRRKAKATTRRRRATRRRRKSARRSTRRSGRGSARRRAAGRKAARTRNLRQAQMSEAEYAYNGRRRRRRKAYAANRRRRSGRRRQRRNGRSVFRKNGAIFGALKIGAVIGTGFVAHRLLSNLVAQQVIARLLPAPAPAAAGFDVAKYSPSIASLLMAGAGAFLVNATVKDAESKKLLIGGIIASALHGVFMNVANAFMPSAVPMLAGPEDGTAARLAAMYGLGAGTSIMPRYAPVNGVGEYFASGVGEYFTSGMNGLGEYFASGVSGLGAYGANPDMQYEAAAGVGGKIVEVSGTHIDPSSDLDRQFNIAEAAAGVGALAPYEAAAGLGTAYEAAAGLGNVTVPRANTWIPGMQDPSIWAGTRPINQGQAATEMVPAGTLATQGGQGVFG